MKNSKPLSFSIWQVIAITYVHSKQLTDSNSWLTGNVVVTKGNSNIISKL